MSRDRVLIEIPSAPLRTMADDFRGYVDRACEPPWPSTQSIRDYLALGVTTVYLRGERTGSEAPAWYLQLAFSACAGMADISAAVAAHWAEIWYQRTGDALAAKHLAPFGFKADRIEAFTASRRFVPFGDLGYAVFYVGEEADTADPESRNFELDTSVVEAIGEVDLTNDWQQLDDALRDVRAAGKCLCQFCAPGLDLSRFDRLSIVKRQA